MLGFMKPVTTGAIGNKKKKNESYCSNNIYIIDKFLHQLIKNNKENPNYRNFPIKI
jgi:hypothetical protein